MVMGGWELGKDEKMHKTFISSSESRLDQNIAWFSFCDKKWSVNTLEFFLISTFSVLPENLIGPARV